MITDESIDIESARYFCIFKDKEFITKIDQALNEKNKSKGIKLMKKAVEVAPQSKLNEVAFFAPAAVYALDYLATAIASLAISYFGSKALTNIVSKATSAMSSTSSDVIDVKPVDPTSYASHNNTVSQVTSPIQTTQQQTFTPELVDNIEDVINSTSSSQQLPSNNTPWWKKLVKWAGGVIMGFFGWLAGLLAQFGIIISAEALAGIFAGLVAISSYLIPRIAYWVRRAMKNNIIAEVKFKTIDGNELQCWYSYKDFKWHCSYLGSRLLSKAKVSNDDANSLTSTNFFKQFKDECEKTIRAIFDDNDRFTATAATVLLIKDNKLSNEYKKIFECKNEILNGFQNIQMIAV